MYFQLNIVINDIIIKMVKLITKDFIIQSITTVKETIQRIQYNINQKIVINLEYDAKNNILLKCNCPKNKLISGCIDKHLLDPASISYFTLGICLPFFYTYLLLLIIGKLCRTCKAINELLYIEGITQGNNLRKEQTLINMLGDILSFILGYFFYTTLNWPVLLFLLISLNLVASTDKGDIISTLRWYINFFKYLNQENGSRLEQHNKEE
jgi:hypothetical protein